MIHPDVLTSGCCSFVHLEDASKLYLDAHVFVWSFFLDLHLHPDAFDDKMTKMNMSFNLIISYS